MGRTGDRIIWPQVQASQSEVLRAAKEPHASMIFTKDTVYWTPKIDSREMILKDLELTDLLSAQKPQSLRLNAQRNNAGTIVRILKSFKP